MIPGGFEYLCRIYRAGPYSRSACFEPIVVRAWTRGGAARKAAVKAETLPGSTVFKEHKWRVAVTPGHTESSYDIPSFYRVTTTCHVTATSDAVEDIGA